MIKNLQNIPTTLVSKAKNTILEAVNISINYENITPQNLEKILKNNLASNFLDGKKSNLFDEMSLK